MDMSAVYILTVAPHQSWEKFSCFRAPRQLSELRYSWRKVASSALVINSECALHSELCTVHCCKKTEGKFVPRSDLNYSIYKYWTFSCPWAREMEKFSRFLVFIPQTEKSILCPSEIVPYGYFLSHGIF
jgi:hypothetical protein